MTNNWVRLPGDAFYTLRGTMSDPDKRRIMVRVGDEPAPYMFQNYWDAYDFVAEHLDRPLLAWAEGLTPFQESLTIQERKPPTRR